MRFPRNAKIFRGQLDAAPFAGVFFLLVILFLLTSRLAFTPGVPIELPDVGRDLPGVADPIVVVAVDADGQFHYDNVNTSEEKLLAQLKAKVQGSTEPLTLVIYADRRVRLDSPFRLMAAARDLGFKNVWVSDRGSKQKSSRPPGTK